MANKLELNWIGKEKKIVVEPRILIADPHDADVVAKKKRGIQYCQTASAWGKANGYKEWHYLFIPSKQVTPQSTFEVLCQRFAEKSCDTNGRW